MGLEIVELIMRVEEEFAIEIQDKEAERLHTAGDLCNLIERKLGLYKAPSNATSRCPQAAPFTRCAAS